MLCPASFDVIGLEGPEFFSDLGALLALVIPGAMWLVLWRVFVTNRSGPRADVTVLGLGNSALPSDCERVYLPIHVRLSYCLVSVVTFVVGFLTYEVFNFLQTFLLARR